MDLTPSTLLVMGAASVVVVTAVSLVRSPQRRLTVAASGRSLGAAYGVSPCESSSAVHSE